MGIKHTAIRLKDLEDIEDEDVAVQIGVRKRLLLDLKSEIKNLEDRLQELEASK